MKNKLFEQVFPLIWHSALGAAILFLSWLAIFHLPMLEGIPLPLDFGLNQLLGALVLSGLVAVLINFSFRLEARLEFQAPRAKPVGTAVKLSMMLIGVLTIYLAYRPLVLPYMDELNWIYHLLFALLFLGVLAILAYNLYTSLAPIFPDSEFVSGGEAVCPKCGKGNKAGARFCAFCGQEIAAPARKCACGALITPGAKFCPGCGIPVAKAAKETAAATEPVCKNCREPLREGARFCPKCGAEQ